MLRVAVPNKGSLSGPAIDMLTEAGYRQRRDQRELVLADPDNDTEFFFLRPRDIATYVGEGQLEVGITGRDLLLDGDSSAEEVLPLGFGASTFRYAAVPGTADAVEDFAGKRIATSYEGLVARDLAGRGIEAEVIHLDGAVETAVRLGVADIIADVVSTGTTLRQAGLEVVGDPILESEAVLIRGEKAGTDTRVDQLMRRLTGVIIARQYVMIDYDCRVETLDAAC
ncbi:MAG: ATP phosphoribosyltransferase, partial [Actinomycetota bacterium]